MTEVTQAQIKAAAEAIENKLPQSIIMIGEELAKAALAAAAQVGEQDKWAEGFKSGVQAEQAMNKVLKTDEAGTIERCKQVVMGIRNCDYQTMVKIAAALDKLKDETP